MSTYRVTDNDGNVSKIIATEEFAKAQYTSYELEPEVGPAIPTPEPRIPEKEWRDQELQQTDWIVAVTDHPQLAAYKTYRQKLRDWPAMDDDGNYINNFPDTRPTLGS